jgi:hypothetical protein
MPSVRHDTKLTLAAQRDLTKPFDIPVFNISSKSAQQFPEANVSQHKRIAKVQADATIINIFPIEKEKMCQTFRIFLYFYGPHSCVITQFSVRLFSPIQPVNLFSQTHCMGDMFRL